MELRNLPIGLFDSGVGGLTIWKEVHERLPKESTIYLADSKNAPYGIKTKQEIIDLSEKNIDVLLRLGVKAIVVACNTATTNAIAELRTKYTLPIIGLEPAIKPASILSQTKKVGVLATKGTLQSEKFRNSLHLYPDVEFIEQIGYHLVQLIENGQINSPEMHQLLREYIEPMIEKKVDHIVLGCTHYPFLKKQIQQIIPPHIEIIDSGLAVAKRVENILETHELTKIDNQPATHQFLINTDATVMDSLLDHQYNIQVEDF